MKRLENCRPVRTINDVKQNALPVGFIHAKYTPMMGGGGCWLYRFDNGYGASVICHQGSYGGNGGLFELAVAKFGPDGLDWDRPDVYDVSTMISGVDSDGIAGWLTLDDVSHMLGEIRGLASH